MAPYKGDFGGAKYGITCDVSVKMDEEEDFQQVSRKTIQATSVIPEELDPSKPRDIANFINSIPDPESGQPKFSEKN